MNRKEFNAVFSLASAHPWLSPRFAALESLLFADCRDQNERNLIMDLIRRIISLDDSRFVDHLRSIVTTIRNEEGFDARKTLILPLSADDAPDSGQYVIYALKPILQELGVSEIHTANRFGCCQRMLTRHPEIYRVFLIDEFLGTGKTLVGRIREIQKQLNGIGRTVSISARFVAAQFQGLLYVQENGIDVYAEIMLERGISDSSLKVDESLATMRCLESILSQNHNEKILPSLGYGQAEALYRRENGNTPNSVFPIFWWTKYNDSRDRPTILTRNMQDA